MKIVRISGGLGNQMFQYAFAMALQKKHTGEKVFVDVQHYHSLFFHHYQGGKGINLHNGFEIEKLFSQADIPLAGPWQLMKLSYWIPNYVLSRIARKLLPVRKTEYVPPYSMNYTFDEQALNNPNDCYYEGFWQSIHYFVDIKEDLMKVFSHQEPNDYNKSLMEQMMSEESAGIHVRRGDYLSESEFSGICSLDYYKQAVKKIKEIKHDVSFYVFSDDIPWCRKELSPLLAGSKFEFVSGNNGADSCWDMFLMMYCKNLVIANSSFSWWAAYLSKTADMIIAPYPWLTRKCTQDMYDERWCKVDVRNIAK